MKFDDGTNLGGYHQYRIGWDIIQEELDDLEV